MVFGFLHNQFAQMLFQTFRIARTQKRAQIVRHAAEQAQVHFALRSNAQAVAGGAEIFAIRRDKADAA